MPGSGCATGGSGARAACLESWLNGANELLSKRCSGGVETGASGCGCGGGGVAGTGTCCCGGAAGGSERAPRHDRLHHGSLEHLPRRLLPAGSPLRQRAAGRRRLRGLCSGFVLLRRGRRLLLSGTGAGGAAGAGDRPDLPCSESMARRRSRLRHRAEACRARTRSAVRRRIIFAHRLLGSGSSAL